MAVAALTLFLATVVVNDPNGYVRDGWVNFVSRFGEQQSALGLSASVSIKLYFFTNHPDLCARHRCWRESCIICLFGELEPPSNARDYADQDLFLWDTNEMLAGMLEATSTKQPSHPSLARSVLLQGDHSASELDGKKAFWLWPLSISNEYRFFLLFLQRKSQQLVQRLRQEKRLDHRVMRVCVCVCVCVCVRASACACACVCAYVCVRV
jgi:hypothetical protein